MSKRPTYAEMLEKHGTVASTFPTEIINGFRFSGIQGGCDICGADMDPEFTAGRFVQISPSVSEMEVVSQCQRCQTEVYLKAGIMLTDVGFGSWFNVKRSYRSPGFKVFCNKIRDWWRSRRGRMQG
jgi:hypothetical protein